MSLNNNSSVIVVQSLTKKYRVGYLEERYDSLAERLASILNAPFRKWKQLRSLSSFKKEDQNVHIALSDISFNVKKGEIVGIIGRNGAGKSTLLKILSRVTETTEGTFDIKGRVASLLEVGTGFHPELTGRENVYLNGTILGMKKKEIDAKFDSIVGFSGVSKFIDTPVKRYSSGMRVRLAFAVAAHLEPEVLIIDEVLAVGDAEFQKKCLGKMGEISSEGRTVLFVSHNMGSVQELCGRVIVLESGKIIYDGNTEGGILKYNGLYEGDSYGVRKEVMSQVKKESICNINNLKIVNSHSKESYILEIDEAFVLSLEYTLKENMNSFVLGMMLKRNGTEVCYVLDSDYGQNNFREKGQHKCAITFPKLFLKEGDYSISFYFNNSIDGSYYSSFENILTFNIVSNNINTETKGFSKTRLGSVVFQGHWKYN